jgi:hypothetical protein
VLLAFVIFLAFESYGNAREQAGQEAVAVAGLFQTAQLFAPLERRRLQGDLVCYARSVVKDGRCATGGRAIWCRAGSPASRMTDVP